MPDCADQVVLPSIFLSISRGVFRVVGFNACAQLPCRHNVPTTLCRDYTFELRRPHAETCCLYGDACTIRTPPPRHGLSACHPDCVASCIAIKAVYERVTRSHGYVWCRHRPASRSAFTLILLSSFICLFCIISYESRSRKLDVAAAGSTSENTSTWTYDYWKQHLHELSARIC